MHHWHVVAGVATQAHIEGHEHRAFGNSHEHREDTRTYVTSPSMRTRAIARVALSIFREKTT